MEAFHDDRLLTSLRLTGFFCFLSFPMMPNIQLECSNDSIATDSPPVVARKALSSWASRCTHCCGRDVMYCLGSACPALFLRRGSKKVDSMIKSLILVIVAIVTTISFGLVHLNANSRTFTALQGTSRVRHELRAKHCTDLMFECFDPSGTSEEPDTDNTGRTCCA